MLLLAYKKIQMAKTTPPQSLTTQQKNISQQIFPLPPVGENLSYLLIANCKILYKPFLKKMPHPRLAFPV